MTNPVAVPSFNLDYFKNLPLVPDINLQTVHLARRALNQSLQECGGSEHLERLLHSDLLESQLIRALDIFLVAPNYLSLTRAGDRDRFVSIHLYAVTLYWLSQRAASPEDLELLSKSKTHLQNK